MRSIKIGSGNEIRYKIKNARVIELYMDSMNVLETINSITNKIEKVTIGEIEVSVGSQFKHDFSEIPSYYKVSRIEKGADSAEKGRFKYTLFSHLRNKTTTYILPCLGNKEEFFDVEGYLINAYLDKSLKKLYLCYRFSKTDYYSNIESRLVKHPNIVKVHNQSGDFDIYEFTIPEQHIEDAKLFMSGKYSKFSEGLKLKIRTFYNLTNKSTLWKVLTKDKTLMENLKESLGVPIGFYWNVDLDSKPIAEEEIWKH